MFSVMVQRYDKMCSKAHLSYGFINSNVTFFDFKRIGNAFATTTYRFVFLFFHEKRRNACRPFQEIAVICIPKSVKYVRKGMKNEVILHHQNMSNANNEYYHAHLSNDYDGLHDGPFRF